MGVRANMIPIMAGLDLQVLREYPLCGIILFGRDIEGPTQLWDLTTRIQRLSIERWGRPVLIAIDQEGGRVSRLKEPFTQFPGMEELGGLPNAVERVKEYARITSLEMRLVGLNMNLAPVLDVRQGRVDEHLRGRTLSDSPLTAGVLGIHIIRVMQGNKIWCVGKHFPGLGRARFDPHKGQVLIDSTMEELQAVDLIPFKMAAQAGVCGFMTSHAIYNCVDPGTPATVSKRALQLLREGLSFDGIVISDDLLMGAITSRFSVEDAAMMAIEAGHDMVLISKEIENYTGLLSMFMEKGKEGQKASLRAKATRNANSLLSCVEESLKFSELKEVKDYFHLPYYL